jgi:serine/threonine-protein kinase
LLVLCFMHAELKPGDVLDGRYVLREFIAQGGMGSVFLADQPALQRTVAIKVLHPELVGIPDHARRIHDEAVLACKVRSPHCIAVFDSGILPSGTPYIVMQHLPGRSLGRAIAEEPVPLRRAVELFDQLLAALSAVHHSGVIHGDVKSDNFLVDLIDGADHVTMIDFGLAEAMGAPERVDVDEGVVVVSGTPEYMAPEVIAGDPSSPASDLYGAGVILYELLTGTTPFGGGTAAEIMHRQARDTVIAPSERRPERGIPPAVDRVVLKALDKCPDQRFPDAATFACELRAAAGSPCVTSRFPASDGTAMQSAARDASPTLSNRQIARGSDCGNAERGEGRETPCRTIAAALRRGDVAGIADGYLELASALVRGHQLAPARRELQEGIDILTAGCDARANDTPLPVNRLVVALAALYEETDDRQLARYTAASADRCPTWTYAIG